MKIQRYTAKGQVVPLLFMQNAVAASQTNVQLPIIEAPDPSTGVVTTAVDDYVMPWPGEIVAVSAHLSTAGTTGSLTVGGTINGTEDADTTITFTTEDEKRGLVPRGKATFVAGDNIGCEITSSADWEPVTGDLAVIIWVLVHLDGI